MPLIIIITHRGQLLLVLLWRSWWYHNAYFGDVIINFSDIRRHVNAEVATVVAHVKLKRERSLHICIRRDDRELWLVRFLGIDGFTLGVNLQRIIKSGVLFVGKHSRAKVVGGVARKMDLHGCLLSGHGRLLFGAIVSGIKPGHPGLIIDKLPVRLLLGLISSLVKFMVVDGFARVYVHRLEITAVMRGVQLGIEKV